MAIEQNILEKIIREAFPDAEIEIKDLIGDNDHYSLFIKSAIFAGKSRIEQHKLVNNALGKHLGTTLHALTIKTSS